MKLKSTIRGLIATLPMMFALEQAQAASAAEEQLRVQSLAATCAACHGTNGVLPNGSVLSSLSYLTPDYIKTNMQWFKNGQRPATVMHQIAKGYTDEQIELIANYLGKKN